MGNPSSSMGRGCDDDDDDHHLISEDVLIQILLWLPVIFLLRFKSVCKSWRSIIESPFFIHLHHATTTLPTSSVSTATKLDVSSSSSSSVLINLWKGKILTLSGEEFELFFEDLVIPATLWEYILSDEMFEVVNDGGVLKDSMELLMVGCCDGIICLHDDFTRHVALWNPAIKQSRILPKPSNLLGFSKTCFKRVVDDDDGCDCEDFVRFGIDIKTNDYKVLLITTYKLRSNNYGTDSEDEEDRMLLRNASRRIHVYSLSTDSWKCIANADANANANATLYAAAAVHPDDEDDDEDDLYISIDKNEGGLYLNGSYFFTATCFNIEEGINKEHRNTMRMTLLLSFDFTGEIFRTIEPPFDLRNNYSYFRDVYFIRLGDKVALIDVKQEFLEYNITEYTIWVLNDQQQQQQHGVKEESWTKSYTIQPPDRFLIINQPPLFITNNGEFAIIYDEYRQDEYRQDDRRHAFLMLLNLITGEKKLLRRDCQGLYRKFVHVYKPSLMPICGNGAAHT